MQAPSRWTLSCALGAAFAALSIADAVVACARSAIDLGVSGVIAALALATGLGVLIGAGIACATELPLRALTRSRAQAPKRTPTLVLGSLVLGSFVLTALGLARRIDLERIDVRAIDPWMPIAALGFAPLTWLSLLALRRRERGPHREPVAMLALIACACGVLGFAGSSPRARSLALAAFDDSSVIVKPIVQHASRALDGDRDGHPRYLCGQACDCDDHDATVHALATDIPGNRRDEDCDGRDATKTELSQLTRAFAKDARTPQQAAPPQAAATTRRPDVLLIVVDTLRADHLGLYGYPRATSPRIDALGKRAVVFEQARSTGPSTRFSMPAMLTSKWFTEIKRNHYEWPAIAESEYLLGERLRDLGYTLAAFHSIRYFRDYFKLGQGFDHWSNRALDELGPELPMISSDFITDEALAWVDAQGDKLTAESHKPFLLWAYYGDPHAEYMRHPGFARFGNEYADRYDGEIAFTDHHVGRLLDGLEQRGLTDNLLVILTSDHGEALDVKADHGALNHSKHLYDELVHVPLLIAGPALTPRRVRTPVSLIDILPTLLELGAAGDPRGRDETLRGVSLTPWLRGEAHEHPPLFFEKHRAIDDPQKGMLAWPYKVIVTVPTGRMQIYDIASDPHEQHDLYASMEVTERDRLVGMLKHWAANILKPARDNWRH